MLDCNLLEALIDAVRKLDEGFRALPSYDPVVPGRERLTEILNEAATRLHDNYPYFHPLYAGQMLKPPHPMAQLVYALAMYVNPNNHALDGGRATSAMEKEAVAEIAAMFGWREHLGHLCGGGTLANLEALWVAGQLRPGKTILASQQAHYTHSRVSGVLQLPFENVRVDARGKMDMGALAKRLAKGDVGTVVATLGTTAFGSVDPMDEILELQRRHEFRIHVDAAYGGYFALLDGLEADTAKAFAQVSRADSIVIDPHKHGLQPYGCGCVLFRDPAIGNLYKHDSPYTYFSSAELHLGEISLECSRPGAAAAALWATQKLLPLTRGGDMAESLQRSRDAAVQLYARIRRDPAFMTAFAPELDIVVFAPRAASFSEASTLSRRMFAEAAKLDLHLAVAELPALLWCAHNPDLRKDRGTLTCLRSVLMKAEHLDWIDAIWERMQRSVHAGLNAAPRSTIA
jgi:glutamate/tyrosine decarboxylase-like PLP-dependent enzyme